MNTTTPLLPTPERVHVLQLVGNGIVGGMETYVLRLVERLPRERFRISAVVPYECPFADQLRQLGAEVVTMPMPEDPSWSSIQGVAALASHGGVDVLHAHMPNAHVLAALAGRLAQCPVMTTIHARQLALCDVEAHRSAGTHVSVVCRHTYYHALAMGVEPRLLSCIPNGVDIQRFRPADGGDLALRRELGVGAEAPLIGFVGRLSPEKGPDLFLRAMRELRRSVPQAHGVLVGDGPMRAELERAAAHDGLAAHLHFTGVRDDVPALLRELDVVASTSHTEAMPLALMEAMASGVPVVAMRVGGVPDLVEHGHTGWLAGPRDWEGVAGRVAELLHDPALRARMGANARARAVERLNLDECIQSTAGLLQRLAARRPQPQRPGEQRPPSPSSRASGGRNS